MTAGLILYLIIRLKIIKYKNMTKLTLRKRLKQIYGGRLNRFNYFKAVTTIIVLFFIALLIFYIIFAILKLFGLNFFETVVYKRGLNILVWIGTAWVSVIGLSLLVRRHHDFNQNWYYPLLIIGGLTLLTRISTDIAELCQIIYTLALFFIKGSKADNKYGPPDKSKSVYQIIGLKK